MTSNIQKLQYLGITDISWQYSSNLIELNHIRVMRLKNMIICTVKPKTKSGCPGEGKQQIARPDKITKNCETEKYGHGSCKVHNQ
jgi:hypothetical protein